VLQIYNFFNVFKTLEKLLLFYRALSNQKKNIKNVIFKIIIKKIDLFTILLIYIIIVQINNNNNVKRLFK